MVVAGQQRLFCAVGFTRFRADSRILLWNLYSEPGNSGKRTASLPLVRNVFAWAREVNPAPCIGHRGLGFGRP